MSTTTTRGVAEAAAAETPRSRPRRGLRSNATLNFWLFTGPFLIGLVIFVFVPIGWSIWLSFFDARYTVTPSHFIGFDNYKQILTNSNFPDSLLTFTVFAAFIALIACRMGLSVTRDSNSVGTHTTSTVVQAIVWVITIDAIFAVGLQCLGL